MISTRLNDTQRNVVCMYVYKLNLLELNISSQFVNSGVTVIDC